MAVLALILFAAWLLIVGGIRGYPHARRTGEVPLRFRDRTASAQWWSRVIATVGLVVAVSAPVAELAGLGAIGLLDHGIVRGAGVVLVGLGIAGTLTAQTAMGASWRGDVDPDARTPLVTSGPFAIVRNPVLVATETTALGMALMVPNILAVIGFGIIVVLHQLQVRLVEEPYLAQVHGDAYRRYAKRTGRFLPRLSVPRGQRRDA